MSASAEAQFSIEKLLLDCVDQAVIAIDISGSIIYWNRFAEELYGWSSDEAFGRNAIELTANDPATAAMIFARLQLGQPWSGELTVKTKGGRCFVAWVTYSTLRDDAGKLVALVAVSHDMAARAAGQDALKQRDAHVTDPASIANFGSWEIDFRSKATFWSPEMFAIHGLPVSTNAPDLATLANVVFPEDRNAWHEAHRKLQEERQPFDLEYRIRLRSDEIRMLHASARVIRAADGGVPKAIGITTDITERYRVTRDLERRAAEQAAVAALGQLALTNAPLAIIFREAIDVLRELQSADACEVLRWSAGSLTVAAQAGWREQARDTPGHQHWHGEYAMTMPRPIVFESLADDDRFAVPDHLRREGIVSGVLARIGAGDRITGVLAIYWRSRRACPPASVDSIRSVANILAQAIARDEAQERLRTRATQQSAIAELSRLALNELSQETLERACDLVIDALGVEYSQYLELSPRGTSTNIRAGRQWTAQPSQEIAIEGTQSGHTIRTGQPVIVPDYGVETRFKGDRFNPYGIKSSISVPVASGRAQFGVLMAQSRTATAFDDADAHFLQSLANVLAESMERDRARREVTAATARYREVFEGAREIIFTIDAQGAFSALNPAFETITGWPIRDWLGRTAAEVIAPEDRPLSGEILERVRRGETSLLELKILTRRGEKRVIDISAFPKASENGAIEVYGFGRDVTERNRVARNLALILGSTDEGIYVVDPHRQCTLANRAACELLGYTQAELLGRDMHELIHAKHANGIEYAAEDCPIYAPGTGRIASADGEVFWRKDGQTVPVEYSAAAIIDGGELRGRVVIFRDVTERRRLESQLDWAQRLTSLGRLAATIAHEFNNVLMGIAPFVDVLRREVEKTPNVTRALDHMSNSIRRGKTVTGEILRYARPVEPTFAAVRVRKLLDQVALEARSMLPSTCILHIDDYDKTLRVSADANQIHQVLSNLILNARDAMDGRGEITITAQREPPSSRFAFAAVPHPERYVHISVRDTGPGIAAERIEQIFEPLFTTKPHGTGLGLALAHQVVMRHGGNIFADSVVGAGSTFHVFLPLSATPLITESAAPPRGARAFHRVLIVDDDEGVAAGLESVLQAEGIAVDVVHTGAAVMGAIAESKPDAVILDVRLPDIDGTKVYAGIADRYPRLPIVFSTGHADETKLRPFLTRPEVQYLLKPYDAAALMECLDRCAAAVREYET